MSEVKPNPVLARKADVGRKDFEARAMSPSKAMRLALSKGFDKTIALPATITSIRQDTLNLAALLDRLNDDSMLIILDGPEGALGTIMLDRSLVTALVEMQTLGYVPKSNLAERKPTRTDAAVAEPVINDLLTRFASLLLEETQERWPTGYRFGAKVADVRALGLAIADVDYIVLEAEVDIFLGTRQGSLLLALPKSPLHAKHRDAQQCSPEWSRQANKTFGAAEAHLEAVVYKYSLPLAQLARLKPGDQLPIPFEALENVALYAGAERVVSKVRLGQMNGMRALRLGHVPGARSITAASKAPEPTSDNPPQLQMAPLPDAEEVPEAPATQAPENVGDAEQTSSAENEADFDFDFELPESEPFSLDDLPAQSGAAESGDVDDIMPMAVVPIDLDDL